MTAPTASESLEIRTSDGVSLVAELRAPADPVATVVVCHPHPLFGGDMYSHVVGAVFDHLSKQGAACLRFNFRGTGGSEGKHDNGRAERLDVAAAIDVLDARWPGLPMILAGYSFGADVSLTIADARIGAWLSVAPPMRVFEATEMTAGPDPREKLIVTGSLDEHRPPEEVTGLIGGWENTSVVIAEGANHFFSIGIETLTGAAAELLARVTEDRQPPD